MNATSVRACLAVLVAGVLGCQGAGVYAQASCPADVARPQETLLSIHGVGAEPVRLSAADLTKLRSTTLTQTIQVRGDGQVRERSLGYEGPLLRDVLLHAGFGGPQDRAARFATVEVVATDHYKAFFSWGELFNASVGDQVLVILKQDGQALDSTQGPVALRSLADLRPGPRHVRQLCALVIKRAT